MQLYQRGLASGRPCVQRNVQAPVVRPAPAAAAARRPAARRALAPQAACSGFVSSGWSSAVRRQVDAKPQGGRTAAPKR